MNHDASSTPSGPMSRGGRVVGSGNVVDAATSLARSSSNTERRRRKKKGKKRRDPGLKKKLSFITHLLKCLDLLVFAELSAMYYMECSLFRFILRAAGQYMYLSPKDEAFPFLMPASRVHVLLVVIPNIISMLLHIFTELPTGPEYHRGYQHGGLIIDFVGQLPPRSRLYYLAADLFILALQCAMLSIHTEREKLRLFMKTFRPLFPDLVQEARQERTLEDLDAEERGVTSDLADVGLDASTEDIEMQPLTQSRSAPNGTANTEEGEGPSAEGSADERPTTHLSDIMNSGNGVLGEYHIIHTMRNAATDVERAAAHSLRSFSYSTTLAALQARRRGTVLGTGEDHG